jgi:4-diphosphocytidyl-2-C-methyl-D-erythritol kinase
LLSAPAKVNLRLKVLGRRADGYHLLSLLNVSSSLADTITLTFRADSEIRVQTRPEGVFSIPSDDNLVTKSVTAFWNALGCDELPLGLQVSIDKRIPIGGGLGGGSSDAGAVLRFFVQQLGDVICKLSGLSPQELDERVMGVAATVGADVPYAYRGGTCWVTGIGEVVQPLGNACMWPGEVLIAVPSAAVPTVPFYAYFRSQHPVLPSVEDELMAQAVSAGLEELSLELIENDFEADVCTFCPAVGEALKCAREFFPDTTSVTGSGSALFSLVPPDLESRVTAYVQEAAKRNIMVHRTTLIR